MEESFFYNYAVASIEVHLLWRNVHKRSVKLAKQRKVTPKLSVKKHCCLKW